MRGAGWILGNDIFGKETIMIRLNHCDDGKGKFQSHEIYLDETSFYNAEYDVWTHDIFDLIGYGETKEEALDDFKKKFRYVMDEWRAFEKMLLETDMLEDSTVEVPCFRNEIK